MMMNTIPLEVFIVTSPNSGFVDLTPIKMDLSSRFPGIIIHEMPQSQLYQALATFSPKPNRIFLLLTHSMVPGQQLIGTLSKIDSMGSGVIMFPTSISNNPLHLLARTPEEVAYNIGLLQKQSAGMYSSNMMKSTGVFGSSADLNPAKLGINIFKSNNEIFKRDMNTLYQAYRNDRRVKFNEVNNLSQIPVIPGGQHLIFVSDADANFFISQLQMMSARPDKFFPVLYNTSTRTIPTGQYFNLATNSLPRAYTQINSYLANLYAVGSMGSIPESSIPAVSRTPVSTLPVLPGTSSHTLIAGSNSVSPGMPSGPFTRLIVLDPNSLFFQQFYRSLPIDYLLINHLEQNAVFREPTILLAPYQSLPHVMNRISPQATNIKCIFYSSTPNFNHNSHMFIGLVTNNPRQIQNYLRSNNVQFLSNTLTTIKNVTFDNQMYGAENSVLATTFQNNAYANTLWGVDGQRNHNYEWIVKRRPGGQKHLTFLADEEQMHMNRTMNTKIIGSLQSKQDFQINSIPNHSQMRFGRTSFNSPPKNYSSEVNEVVTETITHVNPLPQASRVVEEIYEQTVIQAKNRVPSSRFHQQTSNMVTTVDNIPIIPIIEQQQEIIQPPPPPPQKSFSLNHPSSLQMNIQPTYVPPPITTNVVKETIQQQIFVSPPPATIIEVPPITSGYYSSSTTTTLPIQNNHINVRSVSPPRVLPSTNINVTSRKILQPEWVDPIKYQKTTQNGKVVYVMRQEYKNRLIEDAISRPGVTSYNETQYMYESPRVQRRSRDMYETIVKPTYNEVEYIVDSPRIRKSRVIYEDVPTTTYISAPPQIVQASFTSPALDPLHYENRMVNGVQVYVKRNSVSPLRRSNNLVIDQYSTPVQYTTTTTSPTVLLNQPQVLRKSIVVDERLPRNSRVIVHQSPEIVQLRRSNVGLRGSRVYRTARDGDVVLNRYHQPVHLVFKKLNSLLVSTSQLFNDPNYRIHKYYNSNQLASIANTIPFNQPVILVVDEAPDSVDYFTNHSNFSTVVIPKNRSSYRSQQIKYPKYKWIIQEDPQRAYGEILTHIDQFIYNPRPTNYYKNSRAINEVQYLSPNNYSTQINSYNSYDKHQLKSSNASKKVILFPIERSEVKDFVQSRLPNTFDYIPYTDMNSLSKQLEYWPGNNLIVILAEGLAQQVGNIRRYSRNAQYIIYDPDNRGGYNRQEYNASRRVRTVHDLVSELEGMLYGSGRSNEFRRQNRSYNY